MSVREDMLIAAASGNVSASEDDTRTAFDGYSDAINVNQLYHQLRMLKSLFKDIEYQTLTTSIIAKTLISMPPVTQELFKVTLISLKSCLSMSVSVATCERSFSALICLKTISSIDDDAEETYSLCSPSRPQLQSIDSLDFFSV